MGKGELPLNILHVGDMAGSAAITSHMCSKLDYPSVVITDDKTDIWDHGEYYQNTVKCKTTDVMVEVIKDTIDQYDHIVYHDRFDIAAILDDLHVDSSFMFHGNMLRQAPDLYHHVDSLESIDNLFITTEDLKKYAPTAELFHRPVDLDLFYMDTKADRLDMGLCLTQERYMKECNILTVDAEKMVLVADRVKNTRPYSEMPAFLNGFKYYYDIKYQPTHPPMMIPELSQTGLQALACGCAVWSNGIWITKFPEIHSDEWACKEFISVLEE
jgi:hypothetical protein